MYPQSSAFWRASDAYFNRVAGANAGKPADVYQNWLRGSQPPDRGKRYRSMPPSRYTLALSQPDRAAAIRVDPNFRANVLDAIGKTAPTLSKNMDETMGELALNAFKKWPIKSGFSKGMVFLEYTVPNATSIKASVGNGAWYAYYVKPVKLGRKNAWQTLIVKPSKAAIRKMADNLAEDLGRNMTAER